MSGASQLRLAYYGDDFTGSTDALEQLARAGLRTMLFLDPPSPAQLAAMPGLQALGVAGLSRSLDPTAMGDALRPAFAALRALGPRHVHYKVCSTFDSGPQVGNIGKAIDVGREVFGGRFVPLVVGAPALGRYCAFGNLFARYGIGSAGEIHRLDRHPAMKRHPVTPADEADLRLHLARQTTRKAGLFDVLELARPGGERAAALQRIVADGAEIVLFDVMEEAHLARIGALIDGAVAAGPLFSVGSSGIEMALGAHWAEAGIASARRDWPAVAPVDRLLVLSGSCSPVTAGQIEWAQANGFAALPLDPQGPEVEPAVAAAVREIGRGRSVVFFTSRGPTAEAAVPAQMLGTALGRIARGVVEATGLRRLVVAGGDTSSYAGRALGIEAVELIAPLAPGAPLCRVHAPGAAVHGLEVSFKGGQVGAPDYFGAVRRGSISP